MGLTWRIFLTLAVVATSGPAWAQGADEPSRPAFRWDGPDTCQPGDLVGRVAELVGLDRRGLAAKLLRVSARVSPRPEGDWHAQLAIETAAGAGERAFDAEDCRSLVDGIAFIVALAVDPTVQLRAARGEVRSEPTGSAGRRAQLLVRPVVGADIGTLPDVSLAYGVAIGVAWSHLRLEVDGRSTPSQQRTNAAGHGARLREMLTSEGRACWQARFGALEPGACAGASVGWLRSTGLGIAQPETHDSLALDLTAGGALGLRLQDWLWLRGEAFLAVALKRPRFAIDGIDGQEEVYRVRMLAGFLGGGVEFRF